MILKVLLIIGIILILLILALLILALFIKKDYSIEKNILIQKPREDVFNYIKFLKNQEHYNKWVRTDPDMKKEFKGTDGTVGFIYAWNGNNKAGEGEQEIKNLKEGERVECEIRFKRPFEGIASTYLITETVPDNHTLVKWGMTGRNKYPMNLMNLFSDKLLGNDLNISLNDLKRILEKQ